MSDHSRTAGGGGNHHHQHLISQQAAASQHNSNNNHSNNLCCVGGSNDHHLHHPHGGTCAGPHHHVVGIPDADGFIYDPRDPDVLCGRGGASLRHPGNQTYRRLVSLNKGLYVTCLKTEKLKISRSIVAAIREQNGRFLEKDNDRNAWLDIGEKKAVEKTSQALREGAPKLRQKMAELTPSSYGGTTPSSPLQQLDIDPYDHLSDHLAPYGQQQPPPDVHLLAAAQERERLLRQQNFLHTEQLLRHQNSLGSTSNHSNASSSVAAALVGAMSGLIAPPPLAMSAAQQQQHRALHHGDLLQSVVPGNNGLCSNSIASTISSHPLPPPQLSNQHHNHNPGGGGSGVGHNSRHKDLQMDMMRRLSLHDMQQQIQATQEQRQRRSSGLLNSRVSLARELGISESQLSLMSEFSTMSSSIISGMSGGPSRAAAAAMAFPAPGDNVRAMAAVMTGADMDYATSYLHNTAAAAAAAAAYQQQQQQQSTNHNNYSFRQTTTSAANVAAEAAAAVNSSDIDRRRVFAKMKYSRPPSVRSIKGTTPTGQQQQQQQTQQQSQQSQQQQQQQQQHHQLQQGGNSLRSMDDMPDFQMVESNLSLFSLSSKLSLLDMKPEAASTASLEPNHQGNANLPHNPFGGQHQQHQQQQQQQQHRPHPDIAFGAGAQQQQQPYQQRVIVESALTNRSDFLTAGSRHSIMSGLSKISDSSIDNSIFSDLSRKIGNVSTRSVAMSEMSVMEMQDMEDVLVDPRSSSAEDGTLSPPLPPQIMSGGQPIHFLSRQKRTAPPSMDFDMLR
jgi:hypothetical protein